MNMEEVEDELAIKVQALSDLELAVLICLVADQHCIIEADEGLINDVEKELELVSGVCKWSRNQLKAIGCKRGLRIDLRGVALHREHYA
jgi:hypothetical protein